MKSGGGGGAGTGAVYPGLGALRVGVVDAEGEAWCCTGVYTAEELWDDIVVPNL